MGTFDAGAGNGAHTDPMEVEPEEDLVELTAIPHVVRDLMTSRVVTIGQHETLRMAEDGMEQFRFAHLPVVQDGKLIGLVSHSDLLHASSSWLSSRAAERDELIHKLPVSKIMQREVITIGPDETLLDAGRILFDAKIGCLPVVDEQGRLLGILTKGDFVRLAIRLLGGEKPPPPPRIHP
jgi:CBS domain-containing protein